MRALLRHVGVLAAYIFASFAMTWPLGLHMRDHVLAAKWHHDAYTNAMILATRVLNALGQGAGGVYENFFFAPIPQTIVFNENLFGLSLLYAPFYLATGNPLLAYNQVLILSLALAGYGMYLLVRHLVGNGAAAFVSGLAFAFCPYATFEIGRIQLVATAWMPLSLLCLHLAFETGRMRYALLFALSYAMQVGTCLYYAMFMLPIVGVQALWLTLQYRRLALRFWLGMVASGAVCGVLLAAMILPYFQTRDAFALKRSESFARGYDGELSFLGNVHTDNRLLAPLRHVAEERGAHEEIAYPTATMTALALFAVLAALAAALRHRARSADGIDAAPERTVLASAAQLACVVLLSIAAAFGASVVAKSSVAGVLVLLAGVGYWRWTSGRGRMLPHGLGLYVALLGISLVLFLGLEPIQVNGSSVRGLYYYLHTYVPGFNGIRKVSRQAVVVMLVVAVIGGYGMAELLRRYPRWRPSIGGALIVTLVLELACVPMGLARVPAEQTVPAAYGWLRNHRSEAPIAVLPTHDGSRVFRGNVGLALHNYLTLYHRRRTVNGKSSWIPPVTHLFHRVTRGFPSTHSKRLLDLLGVEHVLVHTSDMPRRTAAAMIAALDAQPELYEPVFNEGADYVVRLRTEGGPRLQLLDTPSLPVGAEAVHRWDLKATASKNANNLPLGFDNRANTRWSTGGGQVAGDFVEWRLRRPLPLAALEISNPDTPFEVPGAFELAVATGDGPFRVIVRRDEIEIYRDQVMRPRSFVMRVVLPEGVVGDRLRMTVLDAFPATPWTIQESAVWFRP